MLVISGSTICGVTDATLNVFKLVTILFLVVSVSVEPDFGFIAIFTV